MPKKMEFKAFQCQKRWSSAISTDRNWQGIIPLFIMYTICINNVLDISYLRFIKSSFHSYFLTLR